MRLVAVVLVTAFLAGCSDAPEAEPGGPQARDVEADATTATISGVVVDETIRPLEGATVVLTGAEKETVSDEFGTFVFEDLEAGFYALEARAEGYLPVQSTVDVQEGQVAKPRLMLPADTSPVPFHQTFQFNGHMVASDFYGVYILTGVLGSNEVCRCIFNFTSTPSPETVVVEGVWESSTPRAIEHRMYWELWSESSEVHDTWGASPTLWHVPGTSFGDDDTWTVQVSSGEQPDVEQPFEGFLTFFYVAEAPDGWSVVEGDA